ncbi:MAG: hypothetical protein EP323_02680 [Gammaproteobacteria bacterium]|nr:MAG: hypothetical protein EP323_02680 [Gammaproteobacteria bacterium]
MKKLAIIGLLTTSLALVATPSLARDYDRGKQFSSDHHRYEHRDYRNDRHNSYRRDKHYDKRRYDDDRHYHRFTYSDRYRHDVKHHYKHYRCGYHPGSRARHNHHHYYDSRTGEYLAIIGGTILLTEILRGHH